jgi:hypothetical protein
MAASTQLNIDQYATFATSFTWQTKSNGLAVNLTGFTAALQIRRHPKDVDSIISLQSPSTGISIVPEIGKVFVEIPAEVTGALVPGKYVWDLVLTSAATKKRRLVGGIAVVKVGVTR